MKFKCKYCGIEWELSTFGQIDVIQQVQCPSGPPHQNHVLVALVSSSTPKTE
jgi:hypothetical protein